MEFHIPYIAIRDKLQPDPRRLRTDSEMLKTLEMETKKTQNDTFYYQAQISFLLTGVDEWHWTAYCCVDTFFGSERDPEWYMSRDSIFPLCILQAIESSYQGMDQRHNGA